MHTSFKMLMIHHNLPYHEDHAEQLLGELFDIIYRDQGEVQIFFQGLLLSEGSIPLLIYEHTD